MQTSKPEKMLTNSTQETILFQTSVLTKILLTLNLQSKPPNKEWAKNLMPTSELVKMLIKTFQEITLFHTLGLIKILKMFKIQFKLVKLPSITNGNQNKTKTATGTFHQLQTTHHTATTKMCTSTIMDSE